MRLRRLEIVIIGMTLAFACFVGGFFTGRSWSVVNIAPVSQQNEGTHNSVGIAQPPGSNTQTQQNNSAGSATEGDIESPPVNTEKAPQDNTQTVSTPDEAGSPRGGDGKININLASQSELTDLPGIGNVLASRIVDHRRQHGDFSRIEDIRNVSGIGEKRYEAIQDKITVG